MHIHVQCITGKQIMVVRKQADICLKLYLIKNQSLIKKVFSINFDQL